MALPVDRYTNSDYLNKNPTWDSEDAPWKANLILDILNEHNMHPSKVCEVGCGSGAVLSFLSHSLNDSDFIGYDISNSLHKFWDKLSGERIKFVFGDFNKINNEYYDLLLLLDVVEHIQDPFNFLTTIINSSKKFIFIFLF
jgi:2-polyprenyl-3-methyl-5-hydroxy-6-metoxy-1,4-benzoquinol methylase